SPGRWASTWKPPPKGGAATASTEPPASPDQGQGDGLDHAEVIFRLEALGQAELGNLRQELLHGDAHLPPRQVKAEAQVGAEGKGQVPGLAVEDHRPGVG